MSMGLGMLGLGLAGTASVESAPAPTLSAATDVALGPTSATIGVDTDLGNGTLSWVILLTADSEPSAGQIEAGTKADDSPAEDAGSQAVAGTGTQAISTKPTMLNPGTGYKVAFVQRSAAGTLSNVIVGDGFTTAAVVIGILTANKTSITNPNTASGSLAVEDGDLIFVATDEQSASITITGVTDNLTNTYTAQTAGTVNTNNACMAFYSIVTEAGTLTDVIAAATASTNDVAMTVVAFKGPFSAVDKTSAHNNDFARPWTGDATGTLAQASELAVAWIGVPSTADTLTATSPWTSAGSISTTGLRRAMIAYQNVEATTSLTPTFNGNADAQSIVASMTFKRSV
jgi:hypothetical protein